jgi:hypothetical protein
MLDVAEKQDETAGGDISPAVAAPTKLKGIAICGSQPQTKGLAPFQDRSWRIYACSPDNTPHGLNGPPQCSPLPRVDDWYEVHRPVFDRTRPYPYLEWIGAQPFRLWMRDEVAMCLRTQQGAPLFPNAALYPETAIKDRFGPFTFTSSIAFMMGKAILDIEEMVAKGIMGGDGSPPELGLWGILQASKNEYEKQRQGTQNMIWQATRSGIKVRVLPQSGLFEPPPEDF